MDERIVRFRVGVVVVASVIVTVVLIMLFGAGANVLQRQYTLNIMFPEAPGITVDTPVRKSGVLIGRVADVQLDPQGGVRVSARIYRRFTLRQFEIARIGSGSLLGDAVLEFVPAAEQELVARFDRNHNGQLEEDERKLAQEPIGDGDYMRDGIVASNPLRVLVNLEKNIQGALGSVQAAGNDVSDLARNVNQTVGGNKDQIENILKQTERAVKGLDNTMTTIQKVVGDEEFMGKLGQALKGVPEMITETRETLSAARDIMVVFQRVSEKAENNLDNIQGFTGPLKERGGRLIDNFERSTQNLNELLQQLVTFSQSLNNGQGTLNKLVHDEDLYLRIQRIVANVEDVSKRLRPIVDDVRIFTDKIARDPRELGVRGALDRRPSGLKTGLPWGNAE
jgi:phospholipid/cholesterol/gamma-HCH transport system substrate-binding protein